MEKYDKWEEIAGDEEYDIYNTAEEQGLLSSYSKSIKFRKGIASCDYFR